jgi:hypothetical protein
VLVEALCLSTAGGALGLLIPVLTTTFVERIVPIGLQSFSVSLMDWRLLTFAAALSIATGLLFSVGPAFQSAHASTADVLQQHARGNAGRRSRTFRDGLVVLQVAATVVLLVAAGLMLRTLANLNAVERGFDADNLLTMQVPLMPKYADPSRRLAFYEPILDGVRALPGVRGAAFGSALPFQSTGFTSAFSVDGRQRLPGDDPDALIRIGTAQYLQTLGVTVIEGRLLDARDGVDAPLAVVVNETMVRRFMPGQSALGRQVRFDSTQRLFTVVGAVKDVLERGYGLESKQTIYVTAAQGPRYFPATNLMVRVANDPLDYAREIQRIIRAVDRDQPIRFDPTHDGGDRAQRWRSPSADDAARRVRRAGTRDRLARSLWASRANCVSARPRDRDSDGARRHVAERDADGDVARHCADRRGRGHWRRAGVVDHTCHGDAALRCRRRRSVDVRAGRRPARGRIRRGVRDSRCARGSRRSDARSARPVAAHPNGKRALY